MIAVLCCVGARCQPCWRQALLTLLRLAAKGLLACPNAAARPAAPDACAEALLMGPALLGSPSASVLGTCCWCEMLLLRGSGRR